MAEKNDNWLGSWLSAAKNKSCEVLEFVKKDLEEFGSAVKSEATNVVSTTGNALEKTLKLDEPDSTASTMKRSISSFLGQMNEVLNPSPDDSDTEAILVVDGQEPVKLTKSQQALHGLQQDELTFLEDPDKSLDQQYSAWLEIIEDQLSEDRLSKHLLKSITLKNQYTTLVPLRVEHGVFWKRYLFKKALLEDDMARQEAMEKREGKERHVTEDTVKWEEEDFAKDIELTEEQQIKLLEEYENETKQASPVPKQAEIIGEEIVFQQDPKISPTKPVNKKMILNAKKAPKDNDTKKVAKKINKPVANNKKTIDKGAAIKSSASNSSNSSTDGDWEKISDTDK